MKQNDFLWISGLNIYEELHPNRKSLITIYRRSYGAEIVPTVQFYELPPQEQYVWCHLSVPSGSIFDDNWITIREGRVQYYMRSNAFLQQIKVTQTVKAASIYEGSDNVRADIVFDSLTASPTSPGYIESPTGITNSSAEMTLDIHDVKCSGGIVISFKLSFMPVQHGDYSNKATIYAAGLIYTENF